MKEAEELYFETETIGVNGLEKIMTPRRKSG